MAGTVLFRRSPLLAGWRGLRFKEGVRFSPVVLLTACGALHRTEFGLQIFEDRAVHCETGENDLAGCWASYENAVQIGTRDGRCFFACKPGTSLSTGTAFHNADCQPAPHL